MKRAIGNGYMPHGLLMAALEVRYPKKEYAFLTEVRNSTGFARTVRTADAVALSLWPSRGLVLHGFELKTYRGDWLREKDAPEKAEAIAQFCDFWWLVVAEAAIAPLDEVPPTWGVLAPDADGKTLVALRQAVQFPEPRPLSKTFIAAILRNASDAMVPVASMNEKLEVARRDGIEEGERRVADVSELERLRAIEQRVAAFSKASGIDLQYTYQPDYARRIGDAAKVLMQGAEELHWRLDGLRQLSRMAKELQKQVDEQTKTIEAAAASVGLMRVVNHAEH